MAQKEQIWGLLGYRVPLFYIYIKENKIGIMGHSNDSIASPMTMNGYRFVRQTWKHNHGQVLGYFRSSWGKCSQI